MHRIARFIGRINTEGLQPNVDAMANLEQALAALEQGVYSVGEDAIMLAEKGWEPRFPMTGEAQPVSELVEAFKRLRVEG